MIKAMAVVDGKRAPVYTNETSTFLFSSSLFFPPKHSQESRKFVRAQINVDLEYQLQTFVSSYVNVVFMSCAMMNSGKYGGTLSFHPRVLLVRLQQNSKMNRNFNEPPR